MCYKIQGVPNYPICHVNIQAFHLKTFVIHITEASHPGICSVGLALVKFSTLEQDYDAQGEQY